MSGCESSRPCRRRASYRISVKHSAGDRVVYWHYCTQHFRSETQRLGANEYFRVVDVTALS
ncbi:hypothetical protein [Natronolimnohabitans innermongolicus]|nr:hypothetical protein [Natronolimnohabitans innermongolicus]